MPHRFIRTSVVALSILLSWATTKYIETPFRHSGSANRKALGLIFSLVILGSTGSTIFYNYGYPTRDEHIQQVQFNGNTSHEEFHKYHLKNFHPCKPKKIYDKALIYNGTKRCFQSHSHKNVDTVLIGDSHAEHLFLGLAEKNRHINYVFYIQRGIPTLSNPEFNLIFKEIIQSRSIKKVIINAYWFNKDIPENDLEQTIKFLIKNGKEIFLFDDIPIFGFDPNRCKIKRRLRAYSECSIQKNTFTQAQAKIKRSIEIIKTKIPELNVVESSRYFCDETKCSMTNGDQILYRDPHHLNIEGSRYLAEKLERDYPQILQ